MAKVSVKFFVELKDITGVKRDDFKARNVEELLKKLVEKYPKLKDVLFKNGNLNEEYLIVLNGQNVRFLDGLKTRLKEGDVVSIMSPIVGG
ncbi:MAG: MoaD family protein [Candidatus Odinarchaeota archaeon]|nr:MoaD family protein [Candidatus Odinarchaeota archaeon]